MPQSPSKRFLMTSGVIDGKMWAHNLHFFQMCTIFSYCAGGYDVTSTHETASVEIYDAYSHSKIKYSYLPWIICSNIPENISNISPLRIDKRAVIHVIPEWSSSLTITPMSKQRFGAESSVFNGKLYGKRNENW